MKKNHDNKFKTPEGYFESFNDRLMDKIAKEDAIIPSNDGFSVPEGYFEEFSSKVLPRVETKVVSLKSYRKYYLAAASVAAIAILTLFFNQESTSNFDFDDLASAELDEYFGDNVLDLTTYELAEVIDFESISILDIAESDETIENEMILEYLDENVDEIDDLNIDYDELE